MKIVTPGGVPFTVPTPEIMSALIAKIDALLEMEGLKPIGCVVILTDGRRVESASNLSPEVTMQTLVHSLGSSPSGRVDLSAAPAPRPS